MVNKMVKIGILSQTPGYVTPVRFSFLEEVTLLDGHRNRGSLSILFLPTKSPSR